MIEGLDFAAASLCGARRSQQDDWGAQAHPPSLEGNAALLVVLADGMGGMPGGEQASQMAVQAFLNGYLRESVAVGERLLGALRHANREVAAFVERRPDLNGMGCTLVGALIFEQRMEWISVGDSLILLYRAGRLRRLNPLHVYANELAAQVRRGETTQAEANCHPDRAALTSAVQGNHLTEVGQGSLALEAGDVILLASDGVETLTSQEVAAICGELAVSPVRSITDMIVERIDACNRPNQDNATIIAVRSPAVATEVSRCELV